MFIVLLETARDLAPVCSLAYRDLKKELARLKKETKGTKKVAPSQLPRPAGGKR